MSEFMAILRDSYWEIKSKKILYVLGFILGLSLVVMLLIFFAAPSMEIEGQKIFQADIIDSPTGMTVYAFLFKKLLGFCTFMLAFGSAWILPSFLQKSRIELVLSKPMDRIKLALMKFAGVYINFAIALAIMTTVVWLFFSIGTGLFKFQFFYGLAISCFQFFLIYSIIFFFGVISNSGALAIIGYFLINYAQWILSGTGVIYHFIQNTTLEYVYNISYHILPKLEGVADNVKSAIKGDGITDFYSIYMSLLFTAVLMIISLYIFKRRDF